MTRGAALAALLLTSTTLLLTSTTSWAQDIPPCDVAAVTARFNAEAKLQQELLDEVCPKQGSRYTCWVRGWPVRPDDVRLDVRAAYAPTDWGSPADGDGVMLLGQLPKAWTSPLLGYPRAAQVSFTTKVVPVDAKTVCKWDDEDAAAPFGLAVDDVKVLRVVDDVIPESDRQPVPSSRMTSMLTTDGTLFVADDKQTVGAVDLASVLGPEQTAMNWKVRIPRRVDEKGADIVVELLPKKRCKHLPCRDKPHRVLLTFARRAPLWQKARLLDAPSTWTVDCKTSWKTCAVVQKAKR